jgi:hypothetical protein
VKAFTLPVAHVNYEVSFVKKLVHNGNRCAGLCDFSKRSIVIEINRNRELMRQAIWHEFIHALNYETGNMPSGDEESAVDGEATAIMRVRLEHPWL